MVDANEGGNANASSIKNEELLVYGVLVECVEHIGTNGTHMKGNSEKNYAGLYVYTHVTLARDNIYNV